MKTLVLEKEMSLFLKDSPLSAGNLLKVNFCSICRTDAKMWSEGHRDLVLPRVPGHEICASDNSGRNYVLWPGTSCGKCRFCLDGRENLCPDMKILGFHIDGGFAEYVEALPASMIEVPPGMKNLRIASFAEPLACAIHALSMHKFRKNEKLAVCGAGTLGVMAAFAAASMGAFVTLLEKNPAKIERCLALFRFPENVIIAADIPDSSVSAIINAAPAPEAFYTCLKKLVSGGNFLFFSGISPSNTALPSKFLNEMHYRELKSAGSYGCTRQDMKDALELIASDEAFFAAMIEDTLSLAQVNSILPDVLSGNRFKYVIDPSL